MHVEKTVHEKGLAAKDMAERPKAREESNRRRGRVNRQWWLRLHRWVLLVTGLVLVAYCTAAGIVVFAPELNRIEFPEAHSGRLGDHPISMSEAIRRVESAEPGFHASGVRLVGQTYHVFPRSGGADRAVRPVDPSTGKVLARADLTGGVVGWMQNFHMCFFACKNYAGYVPALAAKVPVVSTWSATKGLSWGSMILVGLGAVLAFAAISGVVMWWPRWGKWRRSLRVRWRASWLVRHRELHRVIGVVTTVPLLFLALTGLAFEVAGAKSVWYTLTMSRPQEVTFASIARPGSADAPIDEVISSAERLGGGRAVEITQPDKKPTSTYKVRLALPSDPLQYAPKAGSVRVEVDRHEPSRAIVTRGGPGQPTSVVLWEVWRFPLHTGYTFPALVRVLWAAAGFAPLVLGVTGTGAWWLRRRRRGLRESK